MWSAKNQCINLSVLERCLKILFNAKAQRFRILLGFDFDCCAHLHHEGNVNEGGVLEDFGDGLAPPSITDHGDLNLVFLHDVELVQVLNDGSMRVLRQNPRLAVLPMPQWLEFRSCLQSMQNRNRCQRGGFQHLRLVSICPSDRPQFEGAQW